MSHLRMNITLVLELSGWNINFMAEKLGIDPSSLSVFLKNEVIDKYGSKDKRYNKYKELITRHFPYIDPEHDILVECLAGKVITDSLTKGFIPPPHFLQSPVFNNCVYDHMENQANC